jgi:Undecaprenyl-phosphate galactose phosphotransferase WbaP
MGYVAPSNTSSEVAVDTMAERPSTGTRRTTDISLVGRIKTADAFHERHWVKWAMILVDIFALQLSLFLGYLSAHQFTGAVSTNQYLALSASMTIVPIGYWLVRLYPGYGFAAVERLRRRVRATAVFMLLYVTWAMLFSRNEETSGILIASLFFALLLPPMIQTTFRAFLIRLDLWGAPVLVLGAAKTGDFVLRTLIRKPEMGLRPVAVFDDDPAKAGRTIEGVPVHQGLLRANDLAEKVKYALLAIPGAGRDLQLEVVRRLKFHHVIIIPDLIGLQSLWVEARDMGGIVGLEIRKNLLMRRNWFIKRSLDYLMGIPLFLLSIPILAIFCLWIMVTSPGTPFYAQVREGRGGKRFRVWKLRTMYPHADRLLHTYLEENPEAKLEWNRFFKLKNDPRVLKGVGRVLRKTSLDELPQLWNVLRGEMSLVGPRPFPHYHLEEFNHDFRKLRRSVFPGMTGLWQIEARSDGDLKVQEQLDTYYIRNWSIWLDLSLLFRTVKVVFSGKGAY